LSTTVTTTLDSSIGFTNKATLPDKNVIAFTDLKSNLHKICCKLAPRANATILRFSALLRSRTDLARCNALKRFKKVKHPSILLSKFANCIQVSGVTDFTAAQTDKLAKIIKPFLPVFRNEAAEIPAINGRFGGAPYKIIRFSKAENLANLRYQELLTRYKNPTSIRIVKKALKSIKVEARVRGFTWRIEAMLTNESRDMPVVFDTKKILGCQCDKFQTNRVIVSGCVKCCVNMPIMTSVCKCKPLMGTWDGYTNEPVGCNHPDIFDTKKFAQAYMKGVCTICSVNIKKDCQHSVFAEDIIRLHTTGVDRHSSKTHVNSIIQAAQVAEECTEDISHV
jgi:hypothetical protein